MKRFHRSNAGFTLMEINLVLFLFGAGITAILGIFPVGLRQAQYAFSDTIQVAFATRVLAAMEANASIMSSSAEDRDLWKDTSSFSSAVLGITHGKPPNTRDAVTVNDGESQIHTTDDDKGILIKHYLSDGTFIRYCLEITQLEYDSNKGMLPYIYDGVDNKPPPRYRAALWVIDMKNGKPKTTKPFIADFQYCERVVTPAEEGE